MNGKNDTKWSFDSKAWERLSTLVHTSSPTMGETPMASLLRKMWEERGLSTRTDVMGNLGVVIGSDKPVHIGLAAHMDTVALQITNLLPSGHLQFRSVGLNPHVLLGQPVQILTAKGSIEGGIGFDTTSQYGQPKGLIEEDLWIDIGAASAAEAATLVKPGDAVVLTPRLNLLNGKFLSGTSLDNRLGIFILNECLNHFMEKGSPLCLHALYTVQEEVGLRGAAIAAAQAKLDGCIVLDVDYATDMPASHENQMGQLELSRGPGLHVKGDNNPVLRKFVEETAQAKGIPCQLSLGRFAYGGTDATPIQVQNGGTAVINLNIPCRYMHSPIEVCHTLDIEYAIQLLIETLERLGREGKRSFIPGLD